MIAADDLTAPLFGALSFRSRCPRLSAQYVARMPVGNKKKVEISEFSTFGPILVIARL